MRKTLLVGYLLIISCTNASKREVSSGIQADTITRSEVKSETLEVSKPKIIEKKKVIPEGRCDINVVLRTQERIAILSEEDVLSFLFTFSNDCKNNVEYGEFSNEVLFEVLLNYPNFVSNILNKDSIYQDVILNELANPVMEMESMDEIIELIKSLEISEQSKNDVVTSFKETLGYQ